MSKGKILVVDDEILVLELLADFLESRGYQVATAANGREAVAAVAQAVPDLVLMDVSMPEMDGEEALRQIVASRPGLPVMMVTANADATVTSRLLGLGAVDYVPKPFDLDYLDQAVSVQVSAAQDR
jgi:CheY-like chemotaxis protein